MYVYKSILREMNANDSIEYIDATECMGGSISKLAIGVKNDILKNAYQEYCTNDGIHYVYAIHINTAEETLHVVLAPDISKDAKAYKNTTFLLAADYEAILRRHGLVRNETSRKVSIFNDGRVDQRHMTLIPVSSIPSGV